MQDVPRGRQQLFVGHGAVGRAKKDGLIGDLPDAAARPDRLIVDLDVWLQFVVLGEPLRVDRVGERRPGPVYLDVLCGEGDAGQRRYRNCGERGATANRTERVHVRSPALRKLEVDERVQRNALLPWLCGLEARGFHLLVVQQDRRRDGALVG